MLWGDWRVCVIETPRSSLDKRIFSKITPSLFTLKEGSTSHLGLLPSGKKRETALLGARNRYALRLAAHQRSRHFLRDGTALLKVDRIIEVLVSWLFADNLQISFDFLGGFEKKA